MTFEDVKRIRENPLMDDIDNKELHKMIDIAVEKQIPKKLECLEYYPNDRDCPNCSTNLVSYGWSINNCPYCGQALDWS